MISSASGRVVRSLGHRQIDWSKPVFKTNSELIATINKFRGFLANADTMATKYSGPPSSIDFDTAKSKIRSKDLVDNLEKFYSSASPPAETYEWSAEAQAEKEALYDDSVAEVIAVKKDLEYYTAYLEKMKANRTTRDTTLTQIREMYPEVAAEVDKEIDNREWFTDVVEACRSPPDASKEKAKLLERYPDQVDIIEAEFERMFPTSN